MSSAVDLGISMQKGRSPPRKQKERPRPRGMAPSFKADDADVADAGAEEHRG